MTLGWRASEADDALQVDIYLESLLVAHGRSSLAVHDVTPLDGTPFDTLDPSERRAARLLADHLQRFHPSVRFEEALAARLRAVAERSGPDRADTRRSAAIVVPVPLAGDLGPLERARAEERERSSAQDRRRVLIGGAIASGVSLAGAAIVAWRAAATPRTPFGRATRAAHRDRPSIRGRA